MFTIKNHLEIENSRLTIGGVDTSNLVNEYGSPIYVTNEQRIRDNFRRYKKAFPDADLFYAAKANGNLTILKILAEEGAGADVFSDGELYTALLAGIPRDKILFNGNSKSDRELLMAVQTGVRVSVDSFDELNTLSSIAKNEGKVVDIAFRVNPDVSPKTHPKISTGLKTSKFGIPHDEVVSAYKQALDKPGVNPVGIHCHIGSQILEVEPFVETVNKMMDLVEQISRLGVEFEFVDIGSGLGIPYEKNIEVPTPNDLADSIVPIFNERCKAEGINPKLVLEPGRYLVGDSAILLTSVNTMKNAAKKFVGIDAGFNTMIRPVMYDAYHHAVVANKADKNAEDTYTIVGPICETGDIMATDRELPEIEKGDVIAFLDVGGYGFSMSSQYNGRPRCAELLVNKGDVDIIRKAETYADLLANQEVPPRFL
ncbi:diaminopimelate decarboxylase [Methanohalobium evestigatum Z-7303]|uniref:Diaminopimelate decarboxylase n=1 Tax=Methanohalobium evestigatum (strain ATCC BAA-1072 / DSM 3721 / NBRC 107634 / OCM 161 / Z-7303) TaxID=644295 RepID=D7EAT6_METEZ|nr:diaminopimelate decarboxylase [Methanohalobium evestigatum]ADI74453.1 diaminopimelate decarboxylase [Methanohalobium evestigatum Z-7303]